MPISNIQLSENSNLGRRHSPRPVQVMTVASGKGGVGKTNISVNLAVAMSASGRRVVLLDADLGLANVDILLGLKPKVNLSHVLDGSHRLEEIIIPGPAGLGIVPSSSGVARMANLSPVEHAGLIRAFSDLNMDLDFMVIDVAAGVSDDVISFTLASQEVIVVVCDEPTSITDAYALIKVLSLDYGLTRFHLVTNMVTKAQEGYSLYQKLTDVCDRYLDVNLHYMGAIPYDPILRKSVQRQEAVVEAYPKSPAARAFNQLAAVADAWPPPQGMRGNLEFFVERLMGNGSSFEEEIQ